MLLLLCLQVSVLEGHNVRSIDFLKVTSLILYSGRRYCILDT